MAVRDEDDIKEGGIETEAQQDDEDEEEEDAGVVVHAPEPPQDEIGQQDLEPLREKPACPPVIEEEEVSKWLFLSLEHS